MKFIHHRKKAFTLYELTIAIALSSIVVGCVISFVVFMSRYTANVNDNADTITGFVALRTQIDAWFSAVDMDYNDVTDEVVIHTVDETAITEGDKTVWVSLGWTTYQVYDSETGSYTFVYSYEISSVVTDDGSTFTFTYPEESSSVSLPSNYILRILEIDDDYTYSTDDEESVELYFTINMPISGRKFYCEVVSYDLET